MKKHLPINSGARVAELARQSAERRSAAVSPRPAAARIHLAQALGLSDVLLLVQRLRLIPRCAGHSRAPHFILVAMFLWVVVTDVRGDSTNTIAATSAPESLETARAIYNAGTRKLVAGKLSEAETLLQSSLARQDERVQPVALYNLGEVRFVQGVEELKKSPNAKATQGRSRAATAAGAGAIQQAAEALAGSEIQPMVEAYLAGRGTRKEMRAATEAVRMALEAHGRTLLKWRRSLGDFRSTAELRPADTNAAQNAEFVAREIAKLVDQMRQMQQAGAALGGKKSELDQMLQQLKGRIPKENMPPGASGGDQEDEGEGTTVESLRGLKESETEGGKEMGMKLSPDEAARLLDGLQSNGKLLPMGQGEQGKPKDRQGKTW